MNQSDCTGSPGPWAGSTTWTQGDAHTITRTDSYSWNKVAGGQSTLALDWNTSWTAPGTTTTANNEWRDNAFQIRCDNQVGGNTGCVFPHVAPTLNLTTAKYPAAAAYYWVLQEKLASHPGSKKYGNRFTVSRTTQPRPTARRCAWAQPHTGRHRAGTGAAAGACQTAAGSHGRSARQRVVRDGPERPSGVRLPQVAEEVFQVSPALAGGEGGRRRGGSTGPGCRACPGAAAGRGAAGSRRGGGRRRPRLPIRPRTRPGCRTARTAAMRSGRRGRRGVGRARRPGGARQPAPRRARAGPPKVPGPPPGGRPPRWRPLRRRRRSGRSAGCRSHRRPPPRPRSPRARVHGRSRSAPRATTAGRLAPPSPSRPAARRSAPATRPPGRRRAAGGHRPPDADGQVTVDLDGVLVLAHSDKQDAATTSKKTYGHHPLMGFVDHRPGGTGEPVAALLGPGNAGSNTAAHHITTARLALAQLPDRYRRGRRTLIRRDSANGTHEFMAWLAQRGRWLSYSVGMVITGATHRHVLKIPESAWTPAVEPDGEVRDGAWVAELTGDLLDGWPEGMRLIVRKERPHPGAQLRITDADGMRLTCFATNTAGSPITALELRHRLRARAEDRIRAARATGLRNLPLHDTAQNPRTRSGWRSSRSPSPCWPGCPCSPRPARPASGNPDASGSACSPQPTNSSPPAGGASSASRSTGPGPARSQMPSHGSHSCRTPAASSLLTPTSSTTPHPERWTQRPPDATLGPSTCPFQPPKAKRSIDSVGGPSRSWPGGVVVAGGGRGVQRGWL